MKCPVCGGKTTGKVGVEHYYCWDCFLEYQYMDHGSKVKVYKVSEDGCLVDYNIAEIS